MSLQDRLFAVINFFLLLLILYVVLAVFLFNTHGRLLVAEYNNRYALFYATPEPKESASIYGISKVWLATIEVDYYTPQLTDWEFKNNCDIEFLNDVYSVHCFLTPQAYLSFQYKDNKNVVKIGYLWRVDNPHNDTRYSFINCNKTVGKLAAAECDGNIKFWMASTIYYEPVRGNVINLESCNNFISSNVCIVKIPGTLDAYKWNLYYVDPLMRVHKELHGDIKIIGTNWLSMLIIYSAAWTLAVFIVMNILLDIKDMIEYN